MGNKLNKFKNKNKKNIHNISKEYHNENLKENLKGSIKGNQLVSIKNIHFLNNLTIDSYSEHFFPFKFNVFKSINNIFYLIYSNKNKSIIFFDFINNKKISEIKNAHSNNITSLRYYLDKIKKTEYIISISHEDNNLKLWNLNNLENILNLKNINNTGGICSAFILKDNNENYIITSNSNYYTTSEPLKIFDFKGNKVKEIKDSNENTFFIDIYYDNETSINYIITGNIACAISYNYNKNEIYHKYNNNYPKKENHSMIIDNRDKIIKLIVSCGDEYIRIWDFHLGILLKKILCNDYLNCICLWDNEYAFVGCDKKIIKLVNLKTGKIIKDLFGHNNYVIDIKKIVHPKYGECIISQGYQDDQIKLWVI